MALRPGDCPFCTLVTETAHPARVYEFPLSVALLHVDQTYRGWCTLITRDHYEHPHEMPDAAWQVLVAELRQLAAAQWRVLAPDRLNYSLFGNQVPHVHWHVIPRYQGDPNWGDPPWPIAAETRLDRQDYLDLAARIAAAIPAAAEG